MSSTCLTRPRDNTLLDEAICTARDTFPRDNLPFFRNRSGRFPKGNAGLRAKSRIFMQDKVIGQVTNSSDTIRKSFCDKGAISKVGQSNRWVSNKVKNARDLTGLPLLNNTLILKCLKGLFKTRHFGDSCWPFFVLNVEDQERTSQNLSACRIWSNFGRLTLIRWRTT